MRYLNLAAHYTASPISNLEGEILECKDLGLPADLCRRIGEWNAEYKSVYHLDEAGRRAAIKSIEELDERGVRLAEEIERAVDGGAKVKYYSEGQMKVLKYG